LSGVAGHPVAQTRYASSYVPKRRSETKRSRIVDTAMRHFAENGYRDAHVADIAAALGIAKGSIFQHFGSKDGLFFEVYKRALLSFEKYLDVPAEVRTAGFFGVLYYRLVRTERMLHEDWTPYRVALLGNYGTDLALKREIYRFLVTEDPYGSVAFVQFGLERGELRNDLDLEMIVSILDWIMERFQDALLTAEFDPGPIRKQGELPEKKETRIQQFLALLQRAVGAPSSEVGVRHDPRAPELRKKRKVLPRSRRRKLNS
jgi:TetR/AcrR family transcriptional regulator